LAKRFTLTNNAFRASHGGAWVIKSRVVGIFDMDIAKVHKIMQRLRNIDKLIDVTSKNPARSLILLDTGEGVLSPHKALALAKYFETEVKG
jgi:regulator of extracellular matrix RemA (YlzA/DUF370 family)